MGCYHNVGVVKKEEEVADAEVSETEIVEAEADVNTTTEETLIG